MTKERTENKDAASILSVDELDAMIASLTPQLQQARESTVAQIATAEAKLVSLKCALENQIGQMAGQLQMLRHLRDTAMLPASQEGDERNDQEK